MVRAKGIPAPTLATSPGSADIPGGARLRVAMLPSYEEPYQRLLRQSLVRRGVEFVSDARGVPSWARRHADALDVVHVHWPEFLISTREGAFAPARAGQRYVRLILALRYLRRRRVALVWTAHNLRPHEPRHRVLEPALYRWLMRSADEVIVHSRHAADRLTTEYGRARRLHVVPHGNYVGVHPPPTATRTALRESLGIPLDAFVFLAFGQVRRYKQLPEIVAAIRSLDQERAHLLIAGAVADASVESEIGTAAKGSPRIHLNFGHVPDDQVTAYFAAADAAVAAQADLFSSGALLLALSLGLPVVAPAHTTADEVAQPPALEPFERGKLADALERMLEGDAGQRRRSAQLAAERWTWDAAADQTLSIYAKAVAP